MKSQSVFLPNLHHSYAQTNGSYAFPNSREGDMLKQAKAEVEHLFAGVAKLRSAVADAEKTIATPASISAMPARDGSESS